MKQYLVKIEHSGKHPIELTYDKIPLKETEAPILVFFLPGLKTLDSYKRLKFVSGFLTYRIYSSISRTFLYLKISPKTGVRLILEASEMTCSNHGTNTYENMRLPYLFASASICTYLINVIEPQ